MESLSMNGDKNNFPLGCHSQWGKLITKKNKNFLYSMETNYLVVKQKFRKAINFRVRTAQPYKIVVDVKIIPDQA